MDIRNPGWVGVKFGSLGYRPREIGEGILRRKIARVEDP
jgi:hypothetical protein